MHITLDINVNIPAMSAYVATLNRPDPAPEREAPRPARRKAAPDPQPQVTEAVTPSADASTVTTPAAADPAPDPESGSMSLEHLRARVGQLAKDGMREKLKALLRDKYQVAATTDLAPEQRAPFLADAEALAAAA
jgi:hypothetical protein